MNRPPDEARCGICRAPNGAPICRCLAFTGQIVDWVVSRIADSKAGDRLSRRINARPGTSSPGPN